jgi:hypothetical protein
MVLNNTINNSFIIEKKDSEIVKYNMLLDLLKTKLKYKEIK